MILSCNRKTVVRKFLFLALSKQQENLTFKNELPPQTQVFFDEMESFEHSKWKPLSIALAVNADRQILGFQVCNMPARGREARISRAKYGRRKDERVQSLKTLFESLTPKIHPTACVFHSDQKPTYPFILRSIFSEKVRHETYKGRRGCVVGQGELKSGGWDPLFPLNHTAAMLRANINRLFRRTWCTTKKLERLSAHIELYVAFHNQHLIQKLT